LNNYLDRGTRILEGNSKSGWTTEDRLNLWLYETRNWSELIDSVR